MNKQKGLTPILIVILFAVAVGGYLIYSNYSNSRYKTAQSTLAPTSNPESSSPPETTDQKTFINTKYQYQFTFPSNFIITDSGTDKIKGDEASILVNRGGQGAPGFPIFYVDVISKKGLSTNISYNFDGFTKNAYKYLSTKIGDTIAPENQAWGETFVRLDDITVDNLKAEVFEGYAYGKPTENGLKDRRLLIEKDQYIYLIGTYYTTLPNDRTYDTYNQILATFKFTDQDQARQKCGSAVGQCKAGYHCVSDPQFNNAQIGDASGICVKD